MDSRTPFRRVQKLTLLLALGLLTALVCSLPGVERSARGADNVVLAVFVSKDSSIKDLKMTELRRIFTNADDSGFSGQRNVPFNHTAHSTDRVGFDQAVLHMTPEEVSRFWIDRKIRGLAGPPRAVDSLSQLLNLVSHTDGGISYARPGHTGGDVRVIRVNGKLPNESGYPLEFSE
ncbi:MAG TPA: hypothetical protein VHW01_29650 [Polyangiaceae bacterium]|jgi:hypothetical protein|nr:hypothetical protein [Polyangiaceae bacterium]